VTHEAERTNTSGFNDYYAPDETEPTDNRRVIMSRATFNGVSDAELLAELARRQKLANTPPMPVANPDWSRVYNMTLEMVKEVSDPDGYSKDFQQYLFEEVMKTVFGPKFFDWWNKGPGDRECF
jgi:hypothetical protein